MALRNIFLYGDLAEKYGKEHRFDVASIGETIKAFNVNFKGFLNSIRRDGRYQIVKGKDVDTGYSLSEQELTMSFGPDDFHIVPVLEGAGGVVNTVLGVALTVVGVYTGQSWLIGMGASLAFGGISSLLAPTPTIQDYSSRETPEDRPSFIFDGPVNTIEQGGAVPLIYGRMMVGSTVISSAIKVEDI